MKKLITFLIICVLLSNVLFAQANWTVQTSSTNANLKSVFFIDINTGWVVGYSGTILKTTNGGSNWSLQIISPANINSVYFTDLNTGYAVGDSLKFLKTTNSGNSWSISKISNRDSYYETNLNYIYFSTNTMGWTSPADTMFRTTNAGNNWVNLEIYIQYTKKNAIHFFNESTGWLVGDNGFIIRSVNANAVYPSFSVQTSGTINNLKSVFVSDLATVWAVGDFGTMLKTINGGNDWVIMPLGFGNDLNSIYFTNPTTGWTVGSFGKILKTINAGSNWGTLSSPVNYNLNSVRFINAQTGWIVGDNGIILKTTNGGGVGIKQISALVPSIYSLHQNYPNPFNPTTNIRYDLPMSGFVKLVIFDALGREVETLVNEKQSAGTYEATFNGSQLPSGVYFARLEAGTYNNIIKILMLK